MFRTVTTKQFSKCLSQLKKKGKKGKDAITKTQAAIAQAGMHGEIELKSTNYGESRLPNIEKFDLGDGYRLVVQVVNSTKQERAFLFVGDHEDTDQWLENHKDYRWVQKKDDKTLEFIQVTVPDVKPSLIPKFDLDSPESLLDLPLLRNITEQEWNRSNIPVKAINYLMPLTANEWTQDPNGIIEHLEGLCDMEIACLAVDLLEHAHRGEWDSVHRRLEIKTGNAVVLNEADAADVMVEPQNSERFVTWADLAQLPANSDWADWMLFLHPEQKEFVEKIYNGPTRLRGVSGSGKTCVMIHRARRLARRYKQPVILVTLTESMRKLLDLLVGQLCHTEAALIRTFTMTSLTREIISTLALRTEKQFQFVGDSQQKDLLNDAYRNVCHHASFTETIFSNYNEVELKSFLEDEIGYVRTRFLPEEYNDYLTMRRHGRKIPLPDKARQIILSAVNSWNHSLTQSHTHDFESASQTALTHLRQEASPENAKYVCRCVLVDEVQDLSQIEMQILSNLPQSDGSRVVNSVDGMFLVGDGAQTIYQRGFSFKACGISVANRSFVLQKNYRNTREILEAAYGLIASYKFADVDEENIQSPTTPHWSSRHGEKPWIVKCNSISDECDFISTQIAELIEVRDSTDEAEENEIQTELPICVIGFTKNDRNEITNVLEAQGIKTSELREDVSWSNNTIKVSTLESAKGHEFYAVFIMGVSQGAMPIFRVPEDEWQREAARLYVGMTRARDRLFLSYHTMAQDGPSVFLSAISADCSEYAFKNNVLSLVE
jgi:superfamily I DNA/RNA helicase